MEIRVSEGCIGFWLELWGALPDAFNLSIRTPGGENIPELRLGLQQSVTYSFIYEKSRVTIDSAQTVDKTLLVSTPEAFFLFWVQKVCT